MKLTKSDLAAMARVAKKLDKMGGEEINFVCTLPDGGEIEITGIATLLDTIADILLEGVTEFGGENEE